MADVYDREKRSAVMRNIKSKENKSTELALIEIFREQGVLGWLPGEGSPGLCFSK